MTDVESVSQLIEEKEKQLYKVRRKYHDALGNDELRQRYKTNEKQLLNEIDSLKLMLAEGEELYSNPVTMDDALADFLIAKLIEVAHEMKKELNRTDLYPNVRDQIFKKHRAFQDVIWYLEGKEQFHNIQMRPQYVVFSEFPDGSIEFDEAYDREEAEELAAFRQQDDGVTTIYWCVPEAGSYRLIYNPISELDNTYESMPYPVTKRVVESVGIDNLKWPDEATRKEYE